MKYTILILFIVALTIGCIKENKLPSSILSGKVKSIKLLNYRPSDTFVDTYVFYYDSISGHLLKAIHNYDYTDSNITSVVSNVDSVIISKINDSTIQLNYFDKTVYPFEYSYYAYLNGAGYVYAITLEYPFKYNPENMYLYFIYDSNNDLDTLYEPIGREPSYPGFPTVYSRAWDFNYDGNNYLQSTTYTSYDPIQPLSGIPQTFFDYTFTVYPNTGNVPMQRIFGHGFNWVEAILDPMYLLNIDGYEYYKPNKNLINTFSNGTYINNFSYTFDANKRIIGMSFNSYENYELNYY